MHTSWGAQYEDTYVLIGHTYHSIYITRGFFCFAPAAAAGSAARGGAAEVDGGSRQQLRPVRGLPDMLRHCSTAPARHAAGAGEA